MSLQTVYIFLFPVPSSLTLSEITHVAFMGYWVFLTTKSYLTWLLIWIISSNASFDLFSADAGQETVAEPSPEEEGAVEKQEEAEEVPAEGTPHWNLRIWDFRSFFRSPWRWTHRRGEIIGRNRYFKSNWRNRYGNRVSTTR